MREVAEPPQVMQADVAIAPVTAIYFALHVLKIWEVQPVVAAADDLAGVAPVVIAQAVGRKMHVAALGFAGVSGIRQGKVFDVEIEETDPTKATTTLTAMCEKLLANTVIENYYVDVG